MIVDEFLGERDLEVRPLDPRLGKPPDINSASVLDDGWPVLIVDVEDLVRSIDNLLGGKRLKAIAGAASAASKARKPAKRILVVDDSITVRELERQLLEGRGYAVDVAVDGVDGWNAVRAGDYHLVISDVDMPRMDGIALVRSIKQDARLKSIPVVIVSYKDREEDRMRGLDAGADGYLTKSSFHDRTFLDAVADLIGEARTRMDIALNSVRSGLLPRSHAPRGNAVPDAPRRLRCHVVGRGRGASKTAFPRRTVGTSPFRPAQSPKSEPTR